MAYSQGSPSHYHKMANYSTGDVTSSIRPLARTPSPTPSEAAELNKRHLFDIQAMKHLHFWFRREWLCTLYSLL